MMIVPGVVIWVALFLFGKSSEASTFLHGVSGGATLAKDFPDIDQLKTIADAEEEVIYITKRDGGREPLDRGKVSLEKCCDIRVLFYLTGCDCW
jgi:hypothetical protein